MTKNIYSEQGFVPCCEIDIDTQERALVVDISKALSNQARLEIILFIGTHRDCNNSDVVNHLPLAQSTISQHLKVLEQTGMIITTPEGQSTKYALNREILESYRALITMLL